MSTDIKLKKIAYILNRTKVITFDKSLWDTLYTHIFYALKQKFPNSFSVSRMFMSRVTYC